MGIKTYLTFIIDELYGVNALGRHWYFMSHYYYKDTIYCLKEEMCT